MRKFFVLGLAFAAVALGGEMTGYISDSKCGKAHMDGSDKSVACVKGCIKGGSKAVFVTDGKVVGISNPDKISESLYGKKVTITGDLSGDSVTISSIKAAD